MNDGMEMVVVFLESTNDNHKSGMLEFEHGSLTEKLEDFINDCIEGGYTDFNLCSSCCNFGSIGIFAKVENCEILYQCPKIWWDLIA